MGAVRAFILSPTFPLQHAAHHQGNTNTQRGRRDAVVDAAASSHARSRSRSTIPRIPLLAAGEWRRTHRHCAGGGVAAASATRPSIRSLVRQMHINAGAAGLHVATAENRR